jgi:hypothetical protein
MMSREPILFEVSEMPCPFPGMDPYIEQPEIWPDFHDRFITHMCEALQPLLRPRYVALTQDRLYVVESDRPIRPDVSVVEARTRPKLAARATALLEMDAPAIFPIAREVIREPLIHIIEPKSGNRLVTSIEVLSPDNKIAGAGRKSYQRKRSEVWRSGANLVEIDLLRFGKPTARIPAGRLEELRPWHYLVVVGRRRPARREVYAVPLQKRLPRIGVPLAHNDADVALDLQAVFAECWEKGAYPDVLRYEMETPEGMSDAERKWCIEQLRAAGFRGRNKRSS